MGGIIRVDLTHGLIVVHRDASNGSLHLLEEIVVQARSTVVLVDDNSDKAIRGQFPASAWAIGDPVDFRVGCVGVTYHTVRVRGEIEGCAIGSLGRLQHRGLVTKSLV